MDIVDIVDIVNIVNVVNIENIVNVDNIVNVANIVNIMDIVDIVDIEKIGGVSFACIWVARRRACRPPESPMPAGAPLLGADFARVGGCHVLFGPPPSHNQDTQTGTFFAHSPPPGWLVSRWSWVCTPPCLGKKLLWARPARRAPLASAVSGWLWTRTPTRGNELLQKLE